MSKHPTVILDTDIGYDPDDLFALLFLQKIIGDNHRTLIITSNEFEDKRYRFLRQILELNKSYVSDNMIATSGSCRELGKSKFTVDTLLTDKVYIDLHHGDSFTSQMYSMIKYNELYHDDEKVTYIGIGGFTNLAKFIDDYSAEAKKMKIFLMGGAIDYERYENWIEYNVKIDPISAEKVINAGLDITLIMAQTTHNPLYEVTQNSSLYKRLKQSTLPIHKLLCDHCDLWFERREFKHGTSMHDPLTVATALGYDFVTLETTKVSIKDNKFIFDENGHTIKYSAPDSKAQEFMEFLEQTLC